MADGTKGTIEERIRASYERNFNRVKESGTKSHSAAASYLIGQVLGWVPLAVEMGMDNLTEQDIASAVSVFNELSGLPVTYKEGEGFLMPEPKGPKVLGL